MRNGNRRTGAALALGLALSSGCGTMIFRNPQDVLIDTNAANAFIRGYGRVPGNIQVDRSKDRLLVVEADGYEPASLKLESTPSWWRIALSIVLNAGHGFFTLFISTAVGCAIDAGSGAWQTIENDSVFVPLERARFEAKPDAFEPLGSGR